MVSDRKRPSDASEPSGLCPQVTNWPYSSQLLCHPGFGRTRSKKQCLKSSADPISHWPHIRTALQTTCYHMSTLISTYWSSVHTTPHTSVASWPVGVAMAATLGLASRCISKSILHFRNNQPCCCLPSSARVLEIAHPTLLFN